MTPDALKACTRDQLAALAREQGISGWHSMRKDELISVLDKPNRRKSGSGKNSASSKTDVLTAPSRSRSASPSAGKTSPAVKANKAEVPMTSTARKKPASENVASTARNTRRKTGPATPLPASSLPARSAVVRDLASASIAADLSDARTDRVDARAVHLNWIQVRWNLSRQTIHRAMLALGTDWHQAQPMLRIVDMSSEDDLVSSTRVICDLPIPAASTMWFAHICDAGKTLRVLVGYRTPQKFFTVGRSGPVRMDDAASMTGDFLGGSACAESWQSDRSEHHRGVSDLTPSQLASLAAMHSRENCSRSRGDNSATAPFELAMNAELHIHGTTHPLAELRLMGKSTPVAKDGQFALRMNLPQGRHVIPAVAVNPGGGEERTLVMAIDVSARELEPRSYDDPASSN